MIFHWLTAALLHWSCFNRINQSYETEGEPCVSISDTSKHHLFKDGPPGRDTSLRNVVDCAHKWQTDVESVKSSQWNIFDLDQVGEHSQKIALIFSKWSDECVSESLILWMSKMKWRFLWEWASLFWLTFLWEDFLFESWSLV